MPIRPDIRWLLIGFERWLFRTFEPGRAVDRCDEGSCFLKLDRLRLRGPNGARDEFHLAAAAQNLTKLAKLILVLQRSPA